MIVPLTWKIKWLRERVDACDEMVRFHERNGDAGALKAARGRLDVAQSILVDYQAQAANTRLSGKRVAHG